MRSRKDSFQEENIFAIFYDLFISRYVFELNKTLIEIWRRLVKFLALRISMFESLVFFGQCRCRNNLRLDCWKKSRLVLRGGKFLEEEASAFFLAEVMASGFVMVSAIGTRIQCRRDMIVF